MAIFSNEEYLSRIAETKQRMLDAGIQKDECDGNPGNTTAGRFTYPKSSLWP